MSEKPEIDRYVTFKGLDCDGDADRLIARLKELSGRGTGSRWEAYFTDKLAQNARMGQDHLFFVGAHVNTLRSFFEECDDADALELLDHLELNCC
ncbi:bisphosphoglycerate-dependent phosphoglycerate mutase [Rhodobium orientis]|uniref:N(2)-fixation sustaining protein CowN n=1 Tax=Rhodobium orientis TaxID=34017 RepID=UPI001790093D|nr:N(2)-fixation sustaining protein CowN [Rhodobium orientis]MBB4302033.1 bisphosphoglycerate-dependent phosphoglycerate mutase [Rhodobium orientis]